MHYILACEHITQATQKVTEKEGFFMPESLSDATWEQDANFCLEAIISLSYSLSSTFSILFSFLEKDDLIGLSTLSLSIQDPFQF